MKNKHAELFECAPNPPIMEIQSLPFSRITQIARRGTNIVYLLANCTATRTYIGWTNGGIQHRLDQHNGRIKGGAKYTSRAGRPWSVVATMTGFSTARAARQFEFASKRAWGIQRRLLHMIDLANDKTTRKDYRRDDLILLVNKAMIPYSFN